MQFRLRTASATAILAMTASLAAAPAALSAATASPVAPERSAVTAECAAAQTALALARASKAHAHRKVVKARKALRKAKHTHQTTKVRKAKRVLKRWQHRYAVRSHGVHVQSARVGYACSAPNSAARATGTGIKLDILAIATGAVDKVIDPTELTNLLDALVPGITGSLTGAQLNGLLAGFNAGTPSLDDATVLLGSVFTPDQLQSLLGGAPDPALVLTLVDNIVGELSGLAGLPDPGTLDTSALQGIVDTVTGLFGGLLTGTGTTSGDSSGTGSFCLLGLLCL